MSPPTAPFQIQSPARPGPWGDPRLAAVVILAAALAAYATSLGGAFVFDDIPAIVENPTIRRLWPPHAALSPPPGGLTVSGRPVLNLTFALNHAFGGLDPRGYHALNLLIHVLAGLALCSLVRRTLELPVFGPGQRTAASPLALAVALLWTVHPLQTEAVTYVVQRAESLMGLCFLLTLLAFLRGATSPRPAPWFALAVACCLLGAGTKEVMATAPVLVFLFDRTFLAGSFAEAWRRRRPVHIALAATWLPLAWLVLANGGNRGGTMGLGLGVEWWRHALTQFEAVTRYVTLAFWPHPLLFEYGTSWPGSAGQVLPHVPGVLALVAGTGYALWRRPALGFLGAWFLIILAPTSLVPGTMQLIVEHRMYLPLAAVLAAAVFGLHRLSGRWTWPVVGVLALAGIGLTAQRNLDYRSAITIWADTAAKRPANANARNNLGNALADAGRLAEAVAEYQAALRHDARMPDAHYNLGLALAELDRPDEAVPHLAESLRLRPQHAQAEAALGNALAALGRPAEAVLHLATAQRLSPRDVDIRYNLAGALAQAGRFDEAAGHYRGILGERPGDAETHNNLGNVLAAVGRREEAVQSYREAIRRDPRHALAAYNLGNTLMSLGRFADAARAYADALRINPDDADFHNNYGITLGQLGRPDEARRHFLEALRLRPDFPAARANLDALGR